MGNLTIGYQLMESMQIMEAVTTLSRTHATLGQSLAMYSYADEPAVIDMDNREVPWLDPHHGHC